jgi:hypothetical protein
VNTVLGDIDRIKLADLNELARERLVPNNRVILVFVPAKKTASENSATRAN